MLQTYLNSLYRDANDADKAFLELMVQFNKLKDAREMFERIMSADFGLAYERPLLAELVGQINSD